MVAGLGVLRVRGLQLAVRAGGLLRPAGGQAGPQPRLVVLLLQGTTTIQSDYYSPVRDEVIRQDM